VSASSTRPRASSASRPTAAAAAAGAVLALDQLTKAWAVAALDDGRTVELVWTLRLKLTFNDGAAFSLGGGGGWLLTLVGLVVIVGVARPVARLPGRLAATALGAVAGGAVGNLVDRIVRDGEVVDFIDLQWWPLFNVADMAICIGAALLVLVSMRHDDDPATA
jgi:signal peptidase II